MTQATRVDIRQWVKHSDQPIAKIARTAFYRLKLAQCPTFKPIHQPLYWLHTTMKNGLQATIQALYFAPLFKTRLTHAPKTMQLYSGMPQVLGSLDLSIGERCRLSGVSSFFGRSSMERRARCRIGANVDIGWQTTIAVGTQVIIGDNVRMAGRCYLAGFPGHPEDPIRRAMGAPDTESQIGDIELADNVWLASGVTVLAGVTIGENTIVGAGSVVTQSLPANVMAAGVPAKVIRPIQKDDRP